METVGIEPTASTLARRDRSVAVVPIARRHGHAGSCHGIPLCSSQGAGTFTPQGGAPHGSQESNLVSAGFGDRPPSRWLTHMKLKAAPSGSPGGGVRLGCDAYPGVFPLASSVLWRDGMAKCQPCSGTSYDGQVFTFPMVRRGNGAAQTI